MTNICITMAVVVAQLTEWLLPTPEVRSLNQVIGKLLTNIYLLYRKYELKEKRQGMVHKMFAALMVMF